MATDIYLDNSMTTRPSKRSISKMLPILTERWGHPSSPHHKGQAVFPDIKESMLAIYELLGANHQDDFVFTSSGAEAVNHVVNAIYFDQTLEAGRNHLITSNIDEAPAIMAIGRLEEMSCVGKMVDANSRGSVSAQIIADALSPRTALVSLSWANGMTGVINPVEEIAELCEDRGVFFHLDATHVLGKMFFDLSDIKATHITFNGDNLHAPKGSGGIWIKGGRHCTSFIVGGIEQAGLRAGSYSIANLAALGEAARESLDARDLMCTEVARLRNKLEEGVANGYSGAFPFFQDEERIPNVTAIAFPGIANEALLFNLNRRGICACIGGGSFQQIGLVLENSGVERSLAHSAVSFSLSRETTEMEIDCAIEIIIEEALRLRKISEKMDV
ncbi:MAG: aminotransferase class V-fold PLP-dependent enzyme [Chlamydiota bacterium]|nr:aminotransferase class V-fold PLP-dependent enzyme [Chlamydiota bacterium]